MLQLRRATTVAGNFTDWSWKWYRQSSCPFSARLSSLGDCSWQFPRPTFYSAQQLLSRKVSRIGFSAELSPLVCWCFAADWSSSSPYCPGYPSKSDYSSWWGSNAWTPCDLSLATSLPPCSVWTASAFPSFHLSSSIESQESCGLPSRLTTSSRLSITWFMLANGIKFE